MSLIPSAAFTDAQAALRAIQAGNAKITLVSKSTGARFTYKISRAKKSEDTDPIFFVSLLSGPDNGSDFFYIGIIKGLPRNGGLQFLLTGKSRATAKADSVKAISWAVSFLYTERRIPSTLEIWHEGSCCRCGRTLTVPESLATGLGPECSQKVLKAPGLQILSLAA